MLQENHFKTIENVIRSGRWVPVYFFQGEESYYINRLIDLILQTVLNETEKDFNQIVFYGSETNVFAIIHACCKYPMIGQRQLVMVKEAQDLKQIDDLIHYVKKPLLATILVLHYKNGKLDGRKKLIEEISRIGIVFESKKIYDNKIPEFIIGYLKEKAIEVNRQIAQMIIDYIGNDLSKIANELDKLALALPNNQKKLTSEFLEKNSGISKEFNCFELQKALAWKDSLKAYRIARYFEKNAKNYPLIFTLSVLFSFFVNLIICHSEKNHSKKHLMNMLGFKWDFQITDYLEAMKQYDSAKTEQNIALIRQTDAKAKGVKNYSVTQGQLLIELIFRLLH